MAWSALCCPWTKSFPNLSAGGTECLEAGPLQDLTWTAKWFPSGFYFQYFCISLPGAILNHHPLNHSRRDFSWLIEVSWIYIFMILKKLVAQMVKNLPVMQETQVWSWGWEDPLEKAMAIHSNVLVWRITWTEEPGGLQSMGLQRVRHDWASNTRTHLWLTHGV